MMTSNLLSRFLPANPARRSVYDDLRAYEEDSASDVEERAGMTAVDEENLHFNDDELDPEAFSGAESRIESESTTFLHQQRRVATDQETPFSPERPSRFLTQSPRLLDEDLDDVVPASLLVERHKNAESSKPRRSKGKQREMPKHRPVPGPSTNDNRAHWEATQEQQKLHADDGGPKAPLPVRAGPGILGKTARQEAMWVWSQQNDLDGLMTDVYEYYQGAGIYCILLEKFVGLLNLIFVTGFITFLTQCVDYRKIPYRKTLSQVMIPRCTSKMTGMPNVIIWLLSLYALYTIYNLLAAIPGLMRMRKFYEHLLGINNSDMQTVLWPEVVVKIMALRDHNVHTVETISPTNRRYIGTQSKERLDAHDIANRLMRKDNYYIAMFNKNVIDLTLPFPFLHGRQLYSKILKFNLDVCIMDIMFNERGHVNKMVLNSSERRRLSNTLRNRFLIAGFVNVLCTPLIVLYVVLLYFLTYFNEYHENPAAIGSQKYTPWAEWKFREFNELPHLFNSRLNLTHEFASEYLEQFPKLKTAQVAKFVSFVTGSLVAVLVLATILDPESFLEFKITGERSTLFYIGILGPIWGIAHKMIPKENFVFNPEYVLEQVIKGTHYMPDSWSGRFHTAETKEEFAELYKPKLVIFFEEVLSIIVTPFLLFFALPPRSDQIIDFFRECTLHVDGLGYICTFAHFDFKKNTGKVAQAGAQPEIREPYWATTKHNKMEMSIANFVEHYNPDPDTGYPTQPPLATYQSFHHPPSFPPLASPTHAADMRGSRMGRSGVRGRKRVFVPPRATFGGHASPMASIFLDSRQASTSGAMPTPPRQPPYQPRNDTIEDISEDAGDAKTAAGPRGREDSGIDEDGWEHSPTRGLVNDGDGDEDNAKGGVVAMLQQLHRRTAGITPGI